MSAENWAKAYSELDRLRGVITVRDDALRALNADNDHLRALNAELLAALQRLADAADDVGVHHYDTDTMAPDVAEMQAATKAARAAAAGAKVTT